MNTLNQHAEQIEVDPGALISMGTLTAEERSQVLGTLNRLATLPPEQWPTDHVHLWRPEKALYVLEATDQLRVFFRRANEGTLTIQHLVMQDTLDYYFPARSAQR